MFARFIALLGMMTGAVMAVGTYMWMEPHPIESFHRSVIPTIVHRGEQVNISAEVVRSKGGCRSTVQRKWTNAFGAIYIPPMINAPARPAGQELPIFTSTLDLPPIAVPGKLELNTTVTFYCNWVQDWLGGSRFPLSDIEFKVVP